MTAHSSRSISEPALFIVIDSRFDVVQGEDGPLRSGRDDPARAGVRCRTTPAPHLFVGQGVVQSSQLLPWKLPEAPFLSQTQLLT